MAKAMLKAAPKTKSAVKKAVKLAPVPEGMAWVTPYLTVKCPETAMAFYTKAFGFTKKFAMPGEDGKIMHAEMSYKDNSVMMGPECAEAKDLTPTALQGFSVTMYVYTENVDKIAEQARKAGAKIVKEPKDQFWGDRTATITDTDGHRWMFATRVKDFKPETCCGGESTCG